MAGVTESTAEIGTAYLAKVVARAIYRQ